MLFFLLFSKIFQFLTKFIILYEKGYGLNLTKVENLNEANPKLVDDRNRLVLLFLQAKIIQPY